MSAKIKCPVLVVHGDSDSVVPINQSYDFARIVNAQVSVIKGADHNYANPSQYNKMKNLITDFFIKEL